MNKKEIIDFFDSRAELWDENMVKNQSKIDKILDSAKVFEGCQVLDIACGTGVLIPEYIKRGAEKCVAVDISSKMLDIAREKYKSLENVEFLLEDAEKLQLTAEFDCAVLYNAFPHFVNPEKLFASVLKSLKRGGRFTIAHSMSREALIRHHSGAARKVSVILPTVNELEKMMSSFFKVDLAISDDEIYIISGKKAE